MNGYAETYENGKLEALIRAGADVNARAANGRTPLHVAADSGSYGGIRILLKAKADPNLKDNQGRTPVQLALVEARNRSLRNESGFRQCSMRPTTVFVRTLTAAERQQLQAGLRSADAFTLRRCQILLASAAGQAPALIGRNLGCTAASVRNAIHAFQAEGLACLRAKSSRPHRAGPLLGAAFDEPLRHLLHQSPRAFDKPRSTWTLALVAQVCFDKGWTPRRLSSDTIRLAIKRLGVSWRRAKRWITSPDPAYARKKKPATA